MRKNTEEKVGEGTYGEVYKIGNVQDGYVAVKRSKIGKADIPFDILREVAMAKYVKHPNIIKYRRISLYKALRVDIEMDYGGITLNKFIRSNMLSHRVHLADDVIFQVLCGLQYLHSNNIVHRDIKPANILIDGRVIRICDVGLCRHIPDTDAALTSSEISDDEITSELTYEVCTMNYRPPELFAREIARYTSSIDIWSFGCVLYEYFTGRDLFPGANAQEVIRSIVRNTRIDMGPQWATIVTEYIGWNPLINVNPDSIGFSWCEILSNLLCSYPHPATRYIDYMKQMLKFQECYRSTASNLISQIRTELNTDLGSGVGPEPPKLQTKYFMRGDIKMRDVDRDHCVRNIFNYEFTTNVCQKTILCAVDLFDQFVAHKSPSDTVLVSATCLFIASKVHDYTPLRLNDIIKLHDSYTPRRIIQMERGIVKTIDLNIPALTIMDLLRISTHVLDGLEQLLTDYSQIRGKNIIELESTLLGII